MEPFLNVRPVAQWDSVVSRSCEILQVRSRRDLPSLLPSLLLMMLVPRSVELECAERKLPKLSWLSSINWHYSIHAYRWYM